MVFHGFDNLGVQEVLSGLTILCFALLVVFLLSIKKPFLFKFFIIAFGVRLLLLVINFFFYTLPDSGAGSDVSGFLNYASLGASEGFSTFFNSFPGLSSSYFHSWIVSFFYIFLGESAFLFGAMSLLFSMFSIYFFWLLYHEIWGCKASLNSVLVVAILPTLALYSVIPRYEAFMWPFILIGFLGVCKWFKYRSFNGFLLSSLGFIVAGMFHSPFHLAYAFFIGMIAVIQLRMFFVGAQNGRLYLSGFLFATLFLSLLLWFVFGGLAIPKIGTFESLMLAEGNGEANSIGGNSIRGAASYPAWTAPSSPIDYLWKPIIRAGYFLFSPFPWDIRSTVHLIGLFDAFLYIFLVYKIWCNRSFLWSVKGGREIVIIVLFLSIIYGLGVGNFGTGVRHKTKFLCVLLALAGPLFVKKV